MKDYSEYERKKTSLIIPKINMLIAAILMGNVGLLVSLLSSYPPYTIVLFRGLFGSLFLSLFMLKTHSFSRDFLKKSFKVHWKLLFAIAVIFPIEMLLYFMSIIISGYAIAAFLLYTNGIFLILFLAITKEEKISRVNAFSFVLVIIGVAIIMKFWNGNLFTPGILIGLFSGISLALYIFCKKKIYNKRASKELGLNDTGNFDIFLALWEQLSLAFLFLPFGILDLVTLTLIDLIVAIILGLFATAVANILYNRGVKNDKGGNILILMYFEPLVATINTVLFLHNLSIYTVIGGSLIILANIIILKYSNK